MGRPRLALLFADLRPCTIVCVENVGTQVHSLRQPVRVQHSPQKPNSGGPSRANLRTAIDGRTQENFVLSSWISLNLRTLRI